MEYYVYIVRCKDNSLYCGIATDLKKRVGEHNTSNTKGAKYTKSRRPVTLVYSEVCADKSTALKREIAIKKLKKLEKEKLLLTASLLVTE